MEEKTIVTVITSIFGVSATGFFFLALWLRNIGIELQKIRLDMEKKVPYQWIEETFKPELAEDLRKIIDELKEIKTALIGDVDKKGLLTRVHEHSNKLEDMEKACAKRHDALERFKPVYKKD